MITLIQFFVFVLYVGFIWIRFKKPLSTISDSWYALPYRLKPLFTLFCWGIGFPMLMQATVPYSMFILSGMGLLIVGTATQFYSKLKILPILHFWGAISGIIFALLALWVEHHTYLPLLIWGVASGLLMLLKVKNQGWWMEISACICIMTGLLFTLN